MIDIQHSNERNFCGAITPKEKDKIMKAILDMAAHERKTFCFTPNDVPNLRINEIGVHPTQIYDLQSEKIKKISASIASKIVNRYLEYYSHLTEALKS